MQAPPGDALGHLVGELPVQVAAYIWAAYGGAQFVLLIQRWVRERKSERREDGEPHLELRQSIDLTLTGAFDQLRRDLSQVIERAHQAGQKETANAMQRFLLELELVVQGLTRERRRRPRS